MKKEKMIIITIIIFDFNKILLKSYYNQLYFGCYCFL